jgi:EmrB/QacA subfamily drug resistance transporter
MRENIHERFYKWMALLVVVIGTFMAILDSSIVNIAIPKMMAVFGCSLEEVKWILTSYTLALGTIIPLTGYLGEVFGTKKVYIFALSTFTLGSMLCGFAWNHSAMIFFRVIQALGGGMIMPVGMAIIFNLFPPKERGMALGFWGIASMAAPAIGPTLGGYIIEFLDWRLIFNINIPIGIIGVFFATILLKDSPRKPLHGFDLIGFLSSSVGLVSILYVLGEGSTIDWGDIKNPLLIILGVFSLILFVMNELTHPTPLLDLRVFKIPDFTISQIVTCMTTLAMMGGVYVLPIFLQNIRGYSAMQTGLILFPSAIASGIMMPISGALFDRYGVKPVAIPGLIILAISSYQLSFLSMDTAKTTVTWIATLRGIGMGLAMMPINTQGMNAISQHLVGKASALANAVRQIMASLSVTIMTTIIQTRQSYSYARYAEQVNTFNNSLNTLIKQLQGLLAQGGLGTGEAHSYSYSVISGLLQRQATIDGMNYAVAITAFSVFVGIILVMIFRGKTPHPTKERQTNTANKEMQYEPETGPATVLE